MERTFPFQPIYIFTNLICEIITLTKAVKKLRQSHNTPWRFRGEEVGLLLIQDLSTRWG
jgi:hypothetical protein